MSDKIEYSRLLLKRTTSTGEVPTVTSATTLNQLTDLDLLDGEMFLNTADEKAFVRMGGNIVEFNMIPSGSTSYNFCDTGIVTNSISACTTTDEVTFNSNINLNTNISTISADDFLVLDTGTGYTRTNDIYVESISTDGGTTKWKNGYIDIGSWDMSATSVVNISHSLSLTEYQTIINLDITIVDDSGSHYYSSNHPDIWTDFDSSNINITRLTGGIFDSANFSSTATSRGKIAFRYQPD